MGGGGGSPIVLVPRTKKKKRQQNLLLSLGHKIPSPKVPLSTWDGERGDNFSFFSFYLYVQHGHFPRSPSPCLALCVRPSVQFAPLPQSQPLAPSPSLLLSLLLIGCLSLLLLLPLLFLKCSGEESKDSPLLHFDIKNFSFVPFLPLLQKGGRRKEDRCSRVRRASESEIQFLLSPSFFLLLLFPFRA